MIYYNITIGNDVEEHVFSYRLRDTEPAKRWANLIQQTSVDQIRNKSDMFNGVDTSLNESITRLNNLIVKLNQWIPNKILGYWDNKNQQSSLNKLHIHFPELEKSESDLDKLSQLSEYNDLIHSLENLVNIKKFPELLWIVICPDSDSIPLSASDYEQFTASRYFGELCIHYCHVGRHPLELMSSNDFHCPVEQILPQFEMNAFHSLRFYDDPYSEDQYKAYFKKFFKVSKLNTLLAEDDPKIALGYISIGSLHQVDNHAWTKSQVSDLIKNSYRVVRWEIVNTI